MLNQLDFFIPLQKKDMFFKSKLPKDFEILTKSLEKNRIKRINS